MQDDKEDKRSPQTRKQKWGERTAADLAADAQPVVEQTTRPLRLEWRSPAELADNPRNWRTHPDSQIAALTDVIGSVGWAGVCLYNEATGRLLDGHARRKVAITQGAAEVPVLIGSWTDEQEKLILATFDPISAEATIDKDKLASLMQAVETNSKPLQDLLAKLKEQGGLAPPDRAGANNNGGGDGGSGSDTRERWNVLIECGSEMQQIEMLERLTAEGLKVRSLIS